MADDKKISELTAITAPASADLLALVDSSATETKKITISNFYTDIHKVDTISERTTDAGVTIDGLKIKDAIGFTGALRADLGILSVDSDLTSILDDIASSSAGQILTSTGDATAPTWQTILPLSPSQGDVIYYNGTAWVSLGAGTDGQFLKTQGAAANPEWSFGMFVDAGDTLQIYADSEKDITDTPYGKLKEIKLGAKGTYRIKFTLEGVQAEGTYYGKIYKNGVAYGTERSRSGTGSETFSEDLTFDSDDACELWGKTSGAGNWPKAKNFRIYSTLGSQVITD